MAKSNCLGAMVKRVKILVISDLHIGQSARGDDFCTEEITSGINSTNYVDDFRIFVSENNIEATHLLIAGDISNKADYNEFDLAAERIKDIIKILNISESNIYFVPGNHDSNWESEKMLEKKRYRMIKL